MAEKGNKDAYSDVEAPPVPAESITMGNTTTQDAVFGEMTEDGPNYRSVICHRVAER